MAEPVCYYNSDFMQYWSACGRAHSVFFGTEALPFSREPKEVTCAACVSTLPNILTSQLEEADRQLVTIQARISKICGDLTHLLGPTRSTKEMT